jgi:hypothetical protein
MRATRDGDKVTITMGAAGYDRLMALVDTVCLYYDDDPAPTAAMRAATRGLFDLETAVRSVSTGPSCCGQSPRSVWCNDHQEK